MIRVKQQYCDAVADTDCDEWSNKGCTEAAIEDDGNIEPDIDDGGPQYDIDNNGWDSVITETDEHQAKQVLPKLAVKWEEVKGVIKALWTFWTRDSFVAADDR